MSLCFNSFISCIFRCLLDRMHALGWPDLCWAIITGDHRQIFYPVKTTLVDLLGYNTAILYPSCFPLSLSGPSISNPPTSNSSNYVIISPGPSLSRSSSPSQPKPNTKYVITSSGSSLAGHSSSNLPTSNTNYVITAAGPSHSTSARLIVREVYIAMDRTVGGLGPQTVLDRACLLYTSDAADE